MLNAKLATHKIKLTKQLIKAKIDIPNISQTVAKSSD